MEFTQYLKFVRRWLWLMAVFSLSFAGLVVIMGLGKAPMYESKLTILVNQLPVTDRATMNFQDLVTSERRAVTYSLLLTKRSVMNGVLEKLELSMDPSVLARNISVEFLKNTELLELTVEDTDPERAAQIANAVVDVFNAREAELLDNPYLAVSPSLHAIEPARIGSLVASTIPRDALLAAIVGVLLAIAVGVIVEQFDDRIRTAEQIELTLGVPPIATIGRIPGLTHASHLIAATKTTSAIAESYRMFRAHIDMAREEHPIRSLAVVSAVSGEGKSTTAANLAVAIAQTSWRVVLVDANLRQPSLHTLFKLENRRGLSDLLAQPAETDLSSVLITTEVENLQLITSGSPTPSPAGLLGGAQIGALISSLTDQADLVIVDTPELLGVVDGSLLVKCVDTTLLVARSGFTRAGGLREIYAHLSRSQTPLLGVILNRLSVSNQRLRFPGGGDGGGRRSAWTLSAFGSRRSQSLDMPGAAITLDDVEVPHVSK